MKIEIGKTYMDGWGTRFDIRGLAKTGPVRGEPVYWTLQGNWYTASGKLCRGSEVMYELPNPSDLVSEAK